MASLLAACDRGEAGEDRNAAVVVLVASSLGEIVEEVATRFEASTGTEVRVHVAGSSTLGRQVFAGAGGDICIPADRKWAELVLRSSPTASLVGHLAGNRLVVVGLDGVDAMIDFDDAIPPADWRRVAVADPGHVPAGRYARAAFESIGWWEPLEPRVVPAIDVRAALRLVELGATDVGVVYATDVHAATSVGVHGEIAPEHHDPIVYPVVRLEARPEVDAFLEALGDDSTRKLLESRGFRTIDSTEALP